MSLPAQAFQVMVSLDRFRCRDLVSRFVAHITSQGWGFSYTDAIGGQCKAFYSEVDDPVIRAELLCCIVEVGVSHNRWHVMGDRR